MANITKKGSTWEWMQSWYILLTLPFGLTSSLAFFYIFIRTRKFTWLIASLIYGFLIYLPLWFFIPDANAANSTTTSDGSTLTTILGFIYFGMWILSILHAFLIRKRYLITLEAKEESSNINNDRLRTEIRAQQNVLNNRVDEALIKFEKNDITVKLCRGLFSALPFAPDFRYYFSIAGATERLVFDNNQIERVTERAIQIARSDDGIASAIKVVNAIDMADGGLGIVTGVRNVYAHMKDKDRKRTFEADPQQAADAALKAMGLAYMISRLYEGSISEKISQFFDSKAGQEIALYFSAAEIALPFTDNLIEGTGSLMQQLLEKDHDQSESRFSKFLGNGPLSEAKPIMDAMMNQMDSFLGQVKLYTEPLLKKATELSPGIMNTADSVTGGLATAADMLPAWKFLGARLAAEACVERAIKELNI